MESNTIKTTFLNEFDQNNEKDGRQESHTENKLYPSAGIHVKSYENPRNEAS